jgi:uncharacterized protein
MPDLTPILLNRLYCQLFEYAQLAGIKRLTFLWHGGEPLLLGKSFYVKAWEELRRKKEFTINNLIQTNLLLLDEEWVKLLKRYNVRVGTSVDPIGRERVHKNGKLQYPDWLEKFNLACERNLRMGIVFTVTSRHIDQAERIYNFFKNLQALSSKLNSVRMNPVSVAANCVSHRQRSMMVKSREFGEFLCRIWELWKEDGGSFVIHPLQAWSERIGHNCEFSGHCHDYVLSMDSTGNIYHCGRFADAESPLGNILKANLTDILRHSDRVGLRLRSEILRESECKGCNYWEFCKGGCPYHAYIQFGNICHRSPFCESYRLFFENSGLRPLPSNIEQDEY